MELDILRWDKLYATAAMRLAEAEANPECALVPFKKIRGKKAYQSFLDIDTDDALDGELFV